MIAHLHVIGAIDIHVDDGVVTLYFQTAKTLDFPVPTIREYQICAEFALGLGAYLQLVDHSMNALVYVLGVLLTHACIQEAEQI